MGHAYLLDHVLNLLGITVCEAMQNFVSKCGAWRFRPRLCMVDTSDAWFLVEAEGPLFPIEYNARMYKARANSPQEICEMTRLVLDQRG